MCGIAGYSLDADSGVDRTLAAQALLAGIAERGADAVGYAHRGAGAAGLDPQAAIGCHRPPRRSRAAGRRHPGPRSRSRLHEGPPLDRRQQPPDPARIGGRHPQRDHRQRRGDLRALRLRPGRARDDRRLGGDLRPHGGDRIRPRRARAARGRDGRGLDRRAHAVAAPAGARGRAPSLDRPRAARGVLRLDQVGSRGRRGRSPPDASQARGLRGTAADARGQQDRVRDALQARPLLSGPNTLPPVRTPTRASRASRSSQRSPRRRRPSRPYRRVAR